MLTCWQIQWLLKLAVCDSNIVYRMGKHNAANVLSKQLNYASEVEENSCLLMLQSKLEVIKETTSELFEFPTGKSNEADHARHISDVFI